MRQADVRISWTDMCRFRFEQLCSQCNDQATLLTHPVTILQGYSTRVSVKLCTYAWFHFEKVTLWMTFFSSTWCFGLILSPTLSQTCFELGRINAGWYFQRCLFIYLCLDLEFSKREMKWDRWVRWEATVFVFSHFSCCLVKLV